MPDHVWESPLRAEAAQRRLATIMFTDMVGYSALVQRDETIALALLDEQRAILRAAFAEHGGREIEAVGDGFFVEFPSALSAARCAVVIQQRLAERNSAATSSPLIQVRVGLHVGDVVARGDRVHGDAVNIAARIEPLAPPGGICVSEDVARQIQNKIDLPLQKLGKGELKNIQLPVGIFRIALPWERRHLPFSERVAFSFRRRRTRRLAATIALAITVVAGGGAWLWHTTKAHQAGPVSGRSRVAVLPLANISQNPEDEYFADGMTEELISRLSKIRDLDVIARTSVMTYKGKAKSITEIGRELNVGTVLEGSVRKAGNKARVTVQLIDVSGQNHLWSDDYDRELKDIFSTQSDIAERVAAALKVRLVAAEKQQIGKKGTENLEAYNLYLKGRYFRTRQSRETYQKSKAFFEQAIEKDPNYALAYAGLADVYLNMPWFSDVPAKEAYPKAIAAAEKALQLDSTLAEAYTSLAEAKFMYEWDWSAGERAIKRAVELNPSYVLAHLGYSMHYLTPMGRYQHAIDEMKRALELDPLSITVNDHLGWVLAAAGKYEEAIEQFQKALEMAPDIPWSYIGLGYAHLFKGTPSKAIPWFQKAVEVTKGWSYPVASLGWAYGIIGNSEEAQKVLDGLKERARHEAVQPIGFAMIYASLHNNDQAFEWLERAYQNHSPELIHLRWSGWQVLLGADPRYSGLLRKLGLPDVGGRV